MIFAIYAEPVAIFQFSPSSHTQLSNQPLSYSLRSYTSSINDVSPLTYYSAREFASYFQNHTFLPEEIINRLDLYSSDEFIKFIKTYPEYEKKIKELYIEFNNLSNVKKILYRLIGGYSSRLHKRINSLYEELKTKNHDTGEIISSKKEDFKTFFSEKLNEYKSLENVYKTYSPLLAHAIEKRRKVHNNDELRTVLYKESSDIKNRTHTLSIHSPLYDHQKVLLDCADAVALYNNDTETEKAMTIADFCWALLDYGQAIAEGAALGLYNSIEDILTHPIEATICMVASKQVLVYQLCKVFYNVAEIGITALHDYDQACEQWNDYIEPVNTIIKAIQNKEITLRDTLKTGTALVIGYKAQTKLLSGLVSFLQRLKQKQLDLHKIMLVHLRFKNILQLQKDIC